MSWTVFLAAPKRLYKSACPSVGRSVSPYASNAFAFWPTRSDVCRVYGLEERVMHHAKLPAIVDFDTASGSYLSSCTFSYHNILKLLQYILDIDRRLEWIGSSEPQSTSLRWSKIQKRQGRTVCYSNVFCRTSVKLCSLSFLRQDKWYWEL